MRSVSDVIRWSEEVFPPQLAEPWDAVGLVCGDADWPVDRILVCVDVTEAVAAEAVDSGCQLVVAHHPLLLSGVTSVAATAPAGRIINRLIASRCSLLTCHTNADAASPGVSDALAAVLGLADPEPLVPSPGPAVDKLVVYVPHENEQSLIDALADTGAGRIGQYERCAYMSEGRGTFRPIGRAKPAIGSVGKVETVPEVRLEMVFPRRIRTRIVSAMLAAHPYEEPAFDIVEVEVGRAKEGLGRVGRLPGPITLRAFAQRVADCLPPTAQGVRVAGDLDRGVERVAVCGGSGGTLLADAQRAMADVFVTADLKHHVTADHLGAGGCALIDVAHWASEAPWAWQAAGQLRDAFSSGEGVDVVVSRLRTDPWSHALRSEQ